MFRPLAVSVGDRAVYRRAVISAVFRTNVKYRRDGDPRFGDTSSLDPYDAALLSADLRANNSPRGTPERPDGRTDGRGCWSFRSPRRR